MPEPLKLAPGEEALYSGNRRLPPPEHLDLPPGEEALHSRGSPHLEEPQQGLGI